VAKVLQIKWKGIISIEQTNDSKFNDTTFGTILLSTTEATALGKIKKTYVINVVIYDTICNKLI